MVKIFQQYNIPNEVHLAKFPAHPESIARSVHLDDNSGICIIGGDGTIHEVVNGLMNRADKKLCPLGIIPGGTGNSMSHDLDIMDLRQAFQNIIEGHLQPLDIFKITMKDEVRFGFNILGWGIPVDINILAEKMRWLQGQRYNVASLIEVLRNRLRSVRIEADGETFEGFYGFVLACNTKYTGNGMKMAPQAVFNDGHLDLLLAKKVGRLKLLSLFAKVFKGSHIHDPVIQFKRVKEFSIISKEILPLNIDGNTAGSTPVQVSVLPGHLKIFARRDSPQE